MTESIRARLIESFRARVPDGVELPEQYLEAQADMFMADVNKAGLALLDPNRLHAAIMNLQPRKEDDPRPYRLGFRDARHAAAEAVMNAAAPPATGGEG